MDKSLAPHGVLPARRVGRGDFEEWIVAYDECTNPLLDKARKGSVDLAFGAGAHNADLLPDSAAGRLKAPRKGLRKDRIGRVDEQSNYRCRGDQFVQ
jgi:hypothetical protein